MDTIIFGICSIICFSALFLHELKGTPLMMPPLKSSGLDGNVKALLTFSWHVGSILTVGIGALFACSVLIPGNELMAIIGTVMLICQALLALGLAFKDVNLRKTPAPFLWPFVSMLALTGHVF
tara:strand:+ start:328 stop:696 length:369 start_codon:yes stop_codon:yes gene_type:complete